jgi:subtilisin family serine protease
MFVGARGESSTLIVMPKSGVGAIVIPTATMIVDGATKSERKKLLGEGLEVITEGEEGKLLLRGQLEGIAGIQRIAELARDAVERGNVKSAHPNFMRVPLKVKPSAAGNQPLWHQSNDGNPGIIGADVAAHAAWTITRGNGNIRVAVLDEGVDPSHPALSSAIVDQKDFVDGNPTAMPDGDDAHGTACAGIICARSTSFPGLANECSLIGVRIAKGDGNDGWIFDDFQTADAIDWSWKVAKADVLSNSWGGGAPSPAITNAFQRAQLKGRGNKGCIIVIASGNENSSVGYPGTLPFVLTVGATTPFDVRQSPTAKGGENWWGSNFGPELDIVAPGVKIATTDIRGAAGYQNGDFTKTFNGTSSATPIVAAAAALILSVRPDLKESRVREILQATADRLTVNGGRNNEVGWGRVNLYTALRLARRT